jgi:glutaredoxin 3
MNEGNKSEKPTTLRVFVKSGCPWCTDAVKYLRKEHYEFDEVDVLEDSAAFDEMIALSGQSLAPTLEMNGQILPDFGVPELIAFLDRHRLTPEMTQ